MRSAIVLGAGMVGVGAALHLLQRGVEVTLVDRRGPGEETSHGNAGLIQSEAVEPYAMKRDLASLMRIANGRSNDVHYRLSALPKHAGAILRYWWNSQPHRHALAARAYAALILRAAPEHAELAAAAGAERLVHRGGYLTIHRRSEGLAGGIAEAQRLAKNFGVPFRALDPAATRKLEPALVGKFAGAIEWPEPWWVSDPGALVKAYGDLFCRRGGRLLIGDAQSLESDGADWAVRTAEGRVRAESAVVALGPWSPDLLERFGYRVSMLRMRGYHCHYAGGAALTRPIFDEDWGYVAAPMAHGVRVTTGAEFTGRHAGATPVQLERAVRAARDLFDLGRAVDEHPWFGERPVLARMVPMIAEAPRHRGLWFDFGHGHQGFTLGPVSGRLLAEMMTGAEPLIDPAPYRYSGSGVRAA